MGEAIDLPAATALEVLTAKPEFAGGVWMLIDIDVTRLDTARSAMQSTSHA